MMLYELSNLHYRYSDGTTGLTSISFSIARGESIAILGANGGGKSTLLRILDGLHFPSEGTVRFMGTVLDQAALNEPEFRRTFRQSVGLVFQQAETQLFNPTVFEEIAYGPRQLGLDESDVCARVEDTMQFLGISHLAERTPFHLSGGEKRRVAIGSVLSMNPDVLLFDEPFLGLDPRGQSWLVRTLKELQAVGKTTIIATHTLDLVPRVAKRAIILDESHMVVADDEVENIFSNDGYLLRANLIEDVAELSLR